MFAQNILGELGYVMKILGVLRILHRTSEPKNQSASLKKNVYLARKTKSPEARKE